MVLLRLSILPNEESDFQMELTWIRDKKEPYNLGDCEFHLAFRTDDYEASHDLHEQSGVYLAVREPGYGDPILSGIRTATGWRSSRHAERRPKMKRYGENPSTEVDGFFCGGN